MVTDMTQQPLALPVQNKPRLRYRMTAMDGMAFVPNVSLTALPRGVWGYIRLTPDKRTATIDDGGKHDGSTLR
jgi:hypothetical protein